MDTLLASNDSIAARGRLRSEVKTVVSLIVIRMKQLKHSRIPFSSARPFDLEIARQPLDIMKESQFISRSSRSERRSKRKWIARVITLSAESFDSFMTTEASRALVRGGSLARGAWRL